MNIARLSPYNITDDILRSDLYREVKAGDDTWLAYEIQPDEILRPELIAYRRYGTDLLKWVVMIAAGLDDMREPLEAGTSIRLPPTVWIRERIRYYAGDTDSEG
ncbi:MAG: hypothetical protein ACOYOS_16710 [Syntrophales bacterium]